MSAFFLNFNSQMNQTAKIKIYINTIRTIFSSNDILHLCLNFNIIIILSTSTLIEENKWMFIPLFIIIRAQYECRFSVQCKVIGLPAFYDTITGPTKFIISIFNSVKSDKMARHDYPALRREKISVYYIIIIKMSSASPARWWKTIYLL